MLAGKLAGKIGCIEGSKCLTNSVWSNVDNPGTAMFYLNTSRGLENHYVAPSMYHKPQQTEAAAFGLYK